MPASKSEITITTERTDELSINRSTGSKLTMAKATAVPPSSTPRKLQTPGIEHGGSGLERAGVDDRGDRVGGVVKPVDELEPECDRQRKRKK